MSDNEYEISPIVPDWGDDIPEDDDAEPDDADVDHMGEVDVEEGGV